MNRSSFTKNEVSLSVVTYNTNLADLNKILNSVRQTELDWVLYIIDNSPTDKLKVFSERDERIIYIFNNQNVGFGEGHNKAINLSISANRRYHFVVNPDIYFNEDIISPMVNFMKKNQGVGMMMPKITFPDGRIQYLPKLLPNPFWLLWRKLKRPRKAFRRFISRYELHDISEGKILNVPILSGCFSLLDLKVIKELGGYDENFFMYFEDFDLSRRIHESYETIYYPEVSVVHGYESGANKNPRLFRIFIKSAVTYFNKWGWIFDPKRDKMNASTLARLEGRTSSSESIN